MDDQVPQTPAPQVPVEEVKKEVKEPEVEIEAVPIPEAETVEIGVSQKKGFDLEAWKPRTALGKKVKNGEITSIDQILTKGMTLLEVEIVEYLLPELASDLIAIGQSKGKFGGGKRSIWRQTQKKTMEGNKPKFSALAVIGSKSGYLGLGLGKAKETVPAREKATRKAKLNMIKVVKGCGSWECGCGSSHSIPFKATAKVGSVIMELIPAPKGTGLCIEKECSKLMTLCGIKDIRSKTFGHTTTKLNLVKACFEALKQLSATRVHPEYAQKSGMREIHV